jgi:hypothetical protein
MTNRNEVELGEAKSRKAGTEAGRPETGVLRKEAGDKNLSFVAAR